MRRANILIFKQKVAHAAGFQTGTSSICKQTARTKTPRKTATVNQRAEVLGVAMRAECVHSITNKSIKASHSS
jgi:hypothetical protein